MNNTVVIGKGVVGSAIANHFKIKKYFDLKGSNVTLEEVSKIRYVFICLPTPVKDDRYQTEHIEQIIKQIVDYGSQNVFIIKSTVHPGFADHLMDKLGINCIVSCPEFLSEDTALNDVKRPPFIVVGGRQKNYIEDVIGLHRALDKRSDIIKTDNVTAEMIKVTLNSFFATKVVFANQIFDFTKKVGANYETIKESLEKHPWGAKNHLQVFHKGGRGAGGKCLQKDLHAFAELSQLPLLLKINGINKGLLAYSNKDVD